MLRRQSFSARVLVVDKRLITRPHMRKRDTFYNFLVQMILRHDDGSIQDATLILDESVQDKRSKQALTTYLRRSLNSTSQPLKIRAVRYHDSRSDNIIQAADMVSGAVYAAYHRGNSRYLNQIHLKITDLREWRPQAQ
ncbi:MAG: DUF3800 domain-containing protein [Chloroflexota bacterium]|nr:DUF3800 domain-containing protein [Chloroflexota bacterium]